MEAEATMNGLWFNFAFLGSIVLYFAAIWFVNNIGHKRKIITSLRDTAPERDEQHSLTRYADAHYPREGDTVPGLRRRRVGPPSYEDVQTTLREVNERRGH
jgi:hypothetical protein